MRPALFLVIGLTIHLTTDGFAADATDDATFFEAKVRPLLIARCQECHGAVKPKAGLRLDSREAVLTGGESGSAAVVGKPEESLIVEVIGYRNTVQMPPKAKLPDSEIAILTEWIRRGLPWPNSQAPTPVTSTPGADFSAEQKAFWAFQPVLAPPIPRVANSSWTRSPIDAFVLAGLESRHIQTASCASRRVLLRRVTLDLTGLPPTPDDVREFLEDQSADALERVVDRLLASPAYGERWARHWLDVARYADSNGLDENLAYANAFRYRDYTVRAFANDTQYDQFVIEQIAGDLLPEDSSGHFDPLIATGFLSLGAKMLAEDDPVKMQMDIVDEQVDTISRAFMGLTMGCARCHDHKFDPLTAEDYYGLAGIFKSTQTMDTFSVVARWHERPLATSRQLQARDELRQAAAAQKQTVDKLLADATDTVLNSARRQPGAYLLAATRDLELQEALRAAKPRGNDPAFNSATGAILIEAEDYARGNVLKDRESYGKGIGVLVNRGETPNFAEYDIDLTQGGTFQFEVRYAAAGARPVKVFVNGALVKSDAANKVTGSWTPESQTWFVEAFVTLKSGKNVLRLEQPTFFPHIDKLLFSPVETSVPEVPALADSPGDGTALMPSLVTQWSKAIENSRSDKKSILSAWHQFRANQKLTINHDDEGMIQRMLGMEQPKSLIDLASRYDRLFRDASDAWEKLKESPEGKGAKALPDMVLEAARIFQNDPKGAYAVPADIESVFPGSTREQLKTEREELSRRESLAPVYPETMAVAELKSENLRIHLRGSHLTLGREVPHLLPKILASGSGRELNEGTGRLQLARWLAGREHPLTSRVMVNRIWQWHFGHGLVRSPDNFGRLGERPSHPEMLDWIANDFATSCNWSMKALHRRLIGSAVYQQSTEYNATSALADPENRLLWRFHRLRMDVEVLRDSLIALAGSLDDRMGGTLLPTPNRAYVTSTANVNPAIYNSNRRSVYLPVVRSALFEVFTAFDFADPSTQSGQRDQTTVAPQALFMMNSGFVLEKSRQLATRLLQQADLDQAARLRLLYTIVYCREPSDAETLRAQAYLDRVRSAMLEEGAVNSADLEIRQWTSLCRAVLSANEFVYVE